jgi:tRNA uridine 5-carbamoylmethylation protein Kti12
MNTETQTQQEFESFVKGTLQLMPMRDLLEQANNAPSSTFVVDGLISNNRPRPSILAGYPHIGKSTLARQLAVAVSRGGTFLGRKTTRGRVLYWYSEDSPIDAALDFKKQGAESDDTITLMRAFSDGAELRISEVRFALERAKEENNSYALVIVETATDLLQPSNDNDNSEVASLLTKFSDEVMREFPQTAFLLIHHFNKSQDASVLNNGLLRLTGARAWASKTDNKLYLYQIDGEPKRVISTSIRKGDEIEPTYLEFDKSDNTSTLGQRVADVAIIAKDSQRLKRQQLLEANIIEQVSKSPGMPKSTISNNKTIKGRTEIKIKAVERLIQQGLLSFMKHGKTTHLFTAEQAESDEMTTQVCESWGGVGEDETPCLTSP